MPFLLAWLLLARPVPADERLQVPPCAQDMVVPRPPGRVVRLFELHKDYHPQNVLVIYTYADARCRLVGGSRDKGRLVDMYWRMAAGSSGECYKPTDSRIKTQTLETLEVKDVSAERDAFRIDITQLDQVKHDLPSREAEVVLRLTDSGCAADVRLPLAPSGRPVLHLREVDAKGRYAMGVPRRAIAELELVGVDGQGRPIRRVYRSR